MKNVKLMVIGAHPDDCETAGGIALKMIALGNRVKFLTVTNGCSGHHLNMGGNMTQIRKEEAKRAAAISGIEYEMLDNDDAYLVPGIKERESVMRVIREYAPDVIISPRPNDYHPDHRNTALLIQDCSYLVQVPNFCKATPVLRYQPAIFYIHDNFKKPNPFSPDFVFDVTDVEEQKLRIYHQYTSQMYEWLPWVDGIEDQVPEGEDERFEWLKAVWESERFAPWANKFRAELIKKYGVEKGAAVRFAEALERCEYGGQLTDEQVNGIFPF